MRNKKLKLKFIINTPSLWLKKFPWKKESGHKYSRGRVVVFGGKKESTGATILAAEAALRTGVGSVKFICRNAKYNPKMIRPLWHMIFISIWYEVNIKKVKTNGSFFDIISYIIAQCY